MAWKATDLSVDPPSFQMGQADKEAFTFEAHETVSAVTSKLIDLDTLAEVAASIESTTLRGDNAAGIVVVKDLDRSKQYELAVTFTATGGGRIWTRTLVLSCVA